MSDGFQLSADVLPVVYKVGDREMWRSLTVDMPAPGQVIHVLARGREHHYRVMSPIERHYENTYVGEYGERPLIPREIWVHLVETDGP